MLTEKSGKEPKISESVELNLPGNTINETENRLYLADFQ